MVLSPALNIRSASGPLYDADALAFCRESGATERKAISDFVRGVKNLGLWNSMVCWPLRSTQNAGTGTTAFSLGGLGTFNGTLVNGPTWGVDGVETTTTSSVNLGNAFPETRILIQVHELTDATDLDGATLSSYAGGPERGYEFLHGMAGTPGWRVYAGNFLNNARTSSININDGNFHFVAGITDNASSGIFVDGTAGSFTTMTHVPRLTAVGNLTIGRRAATAVTVPCRTAFAGVVTTYTPNIASAYSLYKSTLGTGLGLP